MKYRDFGCKKAAVIGLGSGDFGGKCPEEKAVELMDAYMDIGGNFIDTARVYGDFSAAEQGQSEEVIGRWMAARRNRETIFLSTKGAHPALDNMHKGRLSRAEVLGDMQRSLDALRTDCVDIYWLHRDDVKRSVGDIMETLQEIREKGWAKMCGVSNWTAERIMEANAWAAEHGIRPIEANQIQFSLARQIAFDDDTTCQMDKVSYRMHRETDMPVVCFSSQAKGFFSKLNAVGVDELPDNLRRWFYCTGNMEIYARVLELSRQTGLSVEQIAIAYLTAQPFPTFALAGASSVSQVQALASAADAVITADQRDDLYRFEE